LLVPLTQVDELAPLRAKADIVGVASIAHAIDQLGAVPVAVPTITTAKRGGDRPRSAPNTPR
jgi:hypothetical protein